MFRTVSILLLAVAAFGPAVAGKRAIGVEPNPANETVDVLDEIVVTSERTGPGLWHVHRGDGDVWILGTVTPLPKGMGWRSAQFEQVLSHAHTVLLAKPLGIGVARALWIYITHRDLLMVPDGRRLRDVMPPALHARFAAQRANYTSDAEKWERFRPLIAAAFLQEAALHKVGLSTHLDIGAEVRALARKHDVDVEELKIAGVRDLLDTLKVVPNGTELTCVGAALSTIESGLPRLVERANAWAAGDVERMQNLPDSAEDLACRAALSTDSGSAELIAQVRRAWLSAIKQSVDHGGTTVAVVNIEVLFEKDGLLDLLRAQGYQVEAP
jgi:uncharacterized protein YbaP (TraB family)